MMVGIGIFGGKAGGGAARSVLSLTCALALAFACGMLAGCGSSSGGASDAVETGTSGPGLNYFEAETLSGSTFTQADLAPYDVTIVNYWQTTCGPCIQEMPEINEMLAGLPGNVNFITVCFDAANDPATAGLFDGTTLVAGSGDLIDVAATIQYTPTTIVYDSQGNMVGEPLVGAPTDAAAAYTALANSALESLGKPTI